MKIIKRIVYSKPFVFVFALIFVILVTEVNRLIGREIILPVFYLLPALLVAWRVGLGEAIIVVVVGSAALLRDDLRDGHFIHATTPYWNATFRIAGDVTAAYMVHLLRQANERLRTSETLREDLTNMLVHDLKNPLVAATMALQIFQRRQQNGADLGEQGVHDQEELLRIVTESNERLRRLIEDILEVAQAEAKEMPLNLQEMDLAEVVRQAVEEATPRVQQDDRVLAEAYPSEPLPVTIDPAKIRRVVDNLLDNALKYAPAAGHLQVRVERQAAEARVSVADDGPGVPLEMQQHIFDKFGQAEAVREGRRMSVGLGLAFARLAVEAHGGRIWVESVPSQGATFTFALPLAPRAPGG